MSTSKHYGLSVCPSADRALQCKYFLPILKANRLSACAQSHYDFLWLQTASIFENVTKSESFWEPFNPKLLFLRLSSCLQASSSLYSPAVVLAQVEKSCMVGLRVDWFTFQSRLSSWLRVSLPSAGALDLQAV